MNYFKTWELVPWELWLLLRDSARHLMHPTTLLELNKVRHDFGKPMTGNTKGEGGLNWRGVRTPRWHAFNPRSRHSVNREGQDPRCCAVDVSGDFHPLELVAFVLQRKHEYSGVMFIEVDITWFHMDTDHRQGYEPTDIAIWSPKRGYIAEDVFIEELKEKGYWREYGNS